MHCSQGVIDIIASAHPQRGRDSQRDGGGRHLETGEWSEKKEKSETINSVMDRELDEAVTEYDLLFNIQIGLLLPCIERLFSLAV